VKRALQAFERLVISALIALMALLILVLVVELAWSLFHEVARNPVTLLEKGELLDLFGSFLLVLIAVELLETMKAYLDEHVVHAELVLEVALIAVARKIIILDVKGLPAPSVLAIAALVLVLAAAYWLEARRRKKLAARPDAKSERPPV
jgi:uncharacterized membrane protein (DUF373 family)